jgi:rod shape-determining protein MreC
MMVADARFHMLHALRATLAVVLYPLQRAAYAPAELANRIGDFFVTQAQLQSENAAFRQERLLNSAQLQRYQSLQSENTHLRKLLGAQQRFGESAILTEIIYAGHDPFARKIIVNQGTQKQVKAGQAVIDHSGVVGQITRSFPLSAEVTLLTDKDQAVPVQLVRNGLRAIVFGFGQDGSLELRYMPVNADIQTGDVLVTSGIDGTYPPGLAVAVVSKIERNAGYSFAKIICTPSAGVDRNKHLLVLAPDQPATISKPTTEAVGATKKPAGGH